MKVIINGQLTDLPSEVHNLKDIVEWKNLPLTATAIAVCGKIVQRGNWVTHNLKDMEQITIITAAFGG